VFIVYHGQGKIEGAAVVMAEDFRELQWLAALANRRAGRGEDGRFETRYSRYGHGDAGPFLPAWLTPLLVQYFLCLFGIWLGSDIGHCVRGAFTAIYLIFTWPA
jgi:hypothetical protein